MNSKFQITLAVLAGVALGATAIQTLHAQSKAPVYVIGEIEVTNPDGYMNEYLPLVRPVIAKAGGKLIASSIKPVPISGSAQNNRVTINAWESVEAARAFYNSPDYLAARKTAEKYAKLVRQYAVEAVVK